MTYISRPNADPAGRTLAFQFEKKWKLARNFADLALDHHFDEVGLHTLGPNLEAACPPQRAVLLGCPLAVQSLSHARAPKQYRDGSENRWSPLVLV